MNPLKKEFKHQTKDKLETDKQLSFNLNCKCLETEMIEVYRADQENECAYPQMIKVCKRCKNEII